jgi:hypothetical protein
MLQEVKDSLNCHHVICSWCMKILVDFVNQKRNIWSCECKILQSSHKTVVFSHVFQSKRFSNIGQELGGR